MYYNVELSSLIAAFVDNPESEGVDGNKIPFDVFRGYFPQGVRNLGTAIKLTYLYSRKVKNDAQIKHVY